MKCIICAIIVACLSGCGLREQVVRVTVPEVHVNPQEGPLIQVKPVQDNRQAAFLAQFPAQTRDRNVGGVVRGGNGVNVVLDSSTTTLKVHAIIVQALRGMGYRTVESCDAHCATITPTLNTFAVTLPFNFWRAATYSQHMLADIDVQVPLQDHGRTSTFEANSHSSNVYQRVSQENWEVALDKAVKRFIVNFQQQMILHTGHPASTAAKTSE